MKALLKRTIPHEVVIPLSGSDVAGLFWELDEHAQADFFNRLSEEDRLVFQLQAVTDAENLTSEGRIAMARIGDYAPLAQPKIPGTFLPENPTPFDYLHAIRAVASRCGNTQIFDLADAGMNLPNDQGVSVG